MSRAVLKQYNYMADKYSNILQDSSPNQESIDAYFNYLNNMDLKGKKVLDLGCGHGYDLSLIKEKGAHTCGIDASDEMIQIARLKNPQSVIKEGTFEAIPFEDKMFDVILSKWALQTANTIEPIYREIIRVLKPGGILLYLSCHPIRQFIEKKRKGKDYFIQEIVKSVFFEGQITALEPSHTFNEYFSPFFFEHFMLESYEEGYDRAAEKVEGDIYPSYFIIKANLKPAAPAEI
jgi:ubiquinone/menaquinone biosynthesis C-methylase UbiE